MFYTLLIHIWEVRTIQPSLKGFCLLQLVIGSAFMILQVSAGTFTDKIPSKSFTKAIPKWSIDSSETLRSASNATIVVAGYLLESKV